MDSQATYTEYKPADSLKSIVANYWKFSVPERDEALYHIIPPDGTILSLSYF